MSFERYNIPRTRDPFVNTPLIKAGVDPQSGEERFWISTWNNNVGCLGVLVTPSGKSRTYRFKKQDGLICCGAYSGYLTDNDTMWLMSDLQAFVKLTLSTGEYEVYRTGAPEGLVFAGMQYDEKTKKLFAGAFVPPNQHAVSFDTQTKSVKIFNDFTKASTMRGGFPIGDGTYGFCVLLNETAVYRWDPVADEISKITEFEAEDINSLTTIACDSQGRHFIHGKGWMKSDGSFDTEYIAKDELLWFGCIEDKVYGTRENVLSTDVRVWDRKTGEIRTIFTAADNSKYNLTADGKIIGVSIYGELTVHTIEGERVLSTMLDTDSPGPVDCIIPIGDGLILGTPFISQRFWLIDTKTGEGIDAGRASPGGGEVLKVWMLHGKAYMASYTQGVLTEFDPKKTGKFPENPKMVCQPKHSMRPIAHATVADDIYYASTHHYGNLGCEITRYNVVTGECKMLDDPIPNHAIASMYVVDRERIIGSTTYEADCATAPPASDECYIIELCPKSLEVTRKTKIPCACYKAQVIGAVDAENILCLFHHPAWEKSMAGLYNLEKCQVTMLDFTIDAHAQVSAAETENRFVVFEKGEIFTTSLVDGKFEKCAEIAKDSDIYRTFVCDGDVYAVTPTQLFVYRNAAK